MAVQSALAEYDRQLNWLQTLITDPEGKRYFIEKSLQTRMKEMQASLARMADFLDYAGSPQDRYHSLHVAGTSGKSTVTTMLAALLNACGLRAGHHVSPYLQLPNEKLIAAGSMISVPGFIELVQAFHELHDCWKRERSAENLRYGEAWVALTYLFFAREQVDWGVIEVGVGGRYDPTNVITPAAALITNVDIDHVKTLGGTIAQIAHHKAGIIKPGRPVVTASRNAQALAVIESQARELAAPLFRLGCEFDYRVAESSPRGSLLSVQAPNSSYTDLFLPLPGEFQAQNAACALAALDVIAAEHNLDLSHENLQAGLGSLDFPGRMEIIQEQPVVVLDGAHNPHKMAALAQSLQDAYPGMRFTVLLGMLAIKDAAAICQALVPLAGRFITAAPDVLGKPALDPQVLAGSLRSLAPDIPVETCSSVAAAVASGLESLPPGQGLLVTGSLYMLGEARDCWIPRQKLLEQLNE